ncbi:MAG TPA: 4Fe-4S dicluster domain-containing protein, partial [Vicinamibacteria bacterium]|nr:4Fe-4S dicluster domain-containing protein [Vicinamibacteria bacterium]
MARLGMVIDTRRCVGCMDCVVACKTENETPEGMNRDWITSATSGRFPELRQTIQSERCNHCDRPPCVTCCPTGASHVHDWGGIVLVTKEECIGCKACLAS